VGSINSLLEGLDQSIAVTQQLKQEETSKNQTLVEYQHSLLEMGKDETLYGSDLPYLFRRICLTAARDLKTNRVSIWILEENNTRLSRKHLFESFGNDDQVQLERSEFPLYFQALETKPIIVAADARAHEDTREFAEGYLKPLSIFSMLDCPIVMDGKAVGVICCEHQQAVKNWSTEDILFVQSLSVHISICYKNLLIRDLLEQVRERNYELVDKSNEIETMNEELNSLNEELTTINERLEEKVKERTSVLETQNHQLTEYAFINSHILRAPLARILGLSSLIARESISIKDEQLIKALIYSSNELDVIIRKISDVLYDGNNLSREDIQAIINRKINSLN
jgi:GAF domain-containing protein